MKKSILILLVMFLSTKGIKAQHQATQENRIIYITSAVLARDASAHNIKYASGYGDPPKDYAYYNRTSRNLRITGLSLLGAGVALGVAGLLVATSNDTYTTYEDELKEERTHRALFITSAATGIVSIPFMIMASAYKRKAKLMVSTQNTGFGTPPNVSKDIVGVTMAITIGK